MEYALPKVMSDLPPEISGYVGQMNESDQLNGRNDCFTNDTSRHNKWNNISEDAKRLVLPVVMRLLNHIFISY